MKIMGPEYLPAQSIKWRSDLVSYPTYPNSLFMFGEAHAPLVN